MHEYVRSAEMMSGLSGLEVLLWIVALGHGVIGIAVGVLALWISIRSIRISRTTATSSEGSAEGSSHSAEQDYGGVGAGAAEGFGVLIESLGNLIKQLEALESEHTGKKNPERPENEKSSRGKGSAGSGKDA